MYLLCIAFSHFIFVLLLCSCSDQSYFIWNIFIFRSAVLWSWWISLPRSCDLCLPELAVWWGPWLPWWFRRVFRHLWVERFSCHSDFPYMCNKMSAVFTDDWCCSWFFFPPSLRNTKLFIYVFFLKWLCEWKHKMQLYSVNWLMKERRCKVNYFEVIVLLLEENDLQREIIF